MKLIAVEGFPAFVCAEIASGLLNYRCVMDTYYDTYTSPEPVDEFLRDMNVKASIPIFRELLIPSGSEPQDVREMATFLPKCKGRSGASVGLCHVALRTSTN